MKINLDIEVSEQFAADVLTVAVDGGIAYWARLGHVVRDGKGFVGLGTAIIEQEASGEDDSAKSAVMSSEAIIEGIKTVLKPTFQVRDDIRSAIFRGVLSGDAGEIDAEAADVIIQAAMFGDIVYG